MSNTKEIDIVIPAFNAGYTIDKTLMSIAIQNIVDKVCVIIVDDYSDKEHTDLYQKYRKQFESYFRIDYIRLKSNSGPGIARKEGLNFGNSKYVTFIDADDVFATSTSLFTLYNIINNKDNSHINFCNSIFQEEVRNQDDEFVTYFDHTNDMTWMFGKIYRREFLEKFNINFNGSWSNEDCGFNTLCLLCNNPDNALYIDRLTYCWNFNPASITKNNDYSFNGLKGYIYNNIWAIHEYENKLIKINKDDLDGIEAMDENIDKLNAVADELNTEEHKVRFVSHIINTLVLLYLYYESLIKDGRSQDQLNQYLDWVIDYYRDVYIRYRECIGKDIFTSCYKQVKQSNERLIENYVESISILEFIKKIDNLMLNTENIKSVTEENNDIIGYVSNDVYSEVADKQSNGIDDEEIKSFIKNSLILPKDLDVYVNDNKNQKYKEYFHIS